MMTKFKVVLTDNIFPDLIIEREMLKEVDAEFIEVTDHSKLKDECRDADAVINTYEQMTKDIINGMEKCRLIIRNGIGVNTIDVNACNAKGIMVANIPTYCLDEVATHAMALLLCLNRKITLLNDTVKSGVWDVKKAIPVYSLQNKVLGLMGFGKIPRILNIKAKAFGMNVIAYDPYVSEEEVAKEGAKKVSLEELVKESDYLSIHSPLTPETKGVFNLGLFCQMKKTAYIINTARGPVINEPELAQALKEGLIAGAGLDVLLKDEVDLSNPLLKMDNVIITPHASWYSEESMMRRRTQTVESVIRVLKGGEPYSLINRKELGR
jgi:D-3-phosphoglycerate dehydrogenase